MDAETLLPCLPARWRGRLTPLTGGLTNRCFHLATGQGQFWLRLGCEQPARLGINRHHELTAHRIAANAGLAPIIRFAYPEAGILILDWLNEPDWRTEPGSTGVLMRQAARLHGLAPPALPALELSERVRFYTKQLTHIPHWLTPVLSAFCRPALNPHFTPVLCHCDLTAGNLMGQRPWLLDWEYAALADPAFELAVIADDRNLNNDECAAMLTHYQAAGGNMSLSRLQARLPWVHLLTLLWALVQHQHTGEAEYAARVQTARNKLMFFL
ncbi:phosphotransferase [Oceanimonas smirnovii]|uniref:Phosphotransferase n=1 Tax=Oceanimonas smirnovii TaxID=264574 RepID=A0ABW7NXE0_9GAMM